MAPSRIFIGLWPRFDSTLAAEAACLGLAEVGWVAGIYALHIAFLVDQVSIELIPCVLPFLNRARASSRRWRLRCGLIGWTLSRRRALSIRARSTGYNGQGSDKNNPLHALR